MFYQTYWDIVGEDTLNIILYILHNQEDNKRFKNTFIIPIPKVNKPYKPVEFRLIDLCNAFIKIITKMIANRIKPILSVIMLLSVRIKLSLFTKGKSLNIMVSYVIFNSLNKSTRRKKGFVGIKLDMEKTYDILDWNFIPKTLINIGFPINIMNLIMNCVNTLSFSILLNCFSIYTF